MLLLAAVIVIVNATRSTSEPPLRSPEVLMEEAMHEGNSEAEQSRRRKAARELVEQAADVTQSLRLLAEQSDDSAVRATAMQGLGKAGGETNVDILLNALEDDDAQVRGQANAALIRIYQSDLGFRAYATPEKRAAVAKEWRNAVGRR